MDTTRTPRRRAWRPAAVGLVLLAALTIAGSGAAKLTLSTLTTNIGTSVEPYNGLSFRLQGCNLVAGTTLPDVNGKYICPDAQYTDGNLGKNWSELDLVPHRVLIDAGANPDSTYHFQVEADYQDSGRTGYDFISAAPEKVSGGCNASFGAQATRGSGTVVIYRDVTVTNQQPNTTCQIDYYVRLAIGAHLWPGSSLHTRLANNIGTQSGIGNKENSIPVNEISPQELSKDMSASQTADNTWDISKGAEPAHIDFANSCTSGADLKQAVAVTITWKKIAADPSVITIVTHVYATNPAARTITVNVSDAIRSGTTVLDTATSSADVPANTKLLVLTHTTTAPAGTANLNDVATGTYTDTATGIPIPQTTTANASASVQVTTTNGTATITDSESISGTGLSFSVDSTTGASGTFGGGYTLGTKTTGPVDWTSATQSGDGTVTYNKTVYLDQPRSTTGSLDDTATVTGSDGFTASAKDSVDIKSAALVDLTINKTIPNVLSGSETQSFSFTVKDKDGNTVATPSVSFAAGETSKSVTVKGLDAGTYTVSEDSATGWNPQSDQNVTITLPSCSGSVTFNNSFTPANAKAVKVTNPAGNEAGWEMILNGPGTPAGGEKVNTDGSGNASFSTQLQEGSYTITETVKSGWDQTGKSGDCSFTVNYPADGGKTFTCTFTNTQRGSIKVVKKTNPAGDPATFSFSGDLSGSIGDTQSIGPKSVAPGTYSTTESVPSGWDLTKIECSDADSSGSTSTGKATFNVAAGENVVCTYTDTKRGHVKVVKTVSGKPPAAGQTFTFQIRSGASTSSDGTVVEQKDTDASGNISFTTDLVAGQTYQICEWVFPGWNTNLAGDGPLFVPNSIIPPSLPNPNVNNLTVCADFSVSAGQTRTFTVDNTPPPGGRALTIGFWKNWASCASSSGKGQKPMLDLALGIASAQTTDPPGGLVVSAGNAGSGWPNYASPWYLVLKGDKTSTKDNIKPAPDCAKAVNLLNKTTIDGKTKKSSDPLFNMTAQLVGAQLNRYMGAGISGVTITNIDQGVLLDGKYKFNGLTYSPNLTAADTTKANCLATQLDNYNNGRPVSAC